ncbi:MAG: diaminopimelate decarboxylase, partial [Pseudomonadota bacterium]|nr:diaminopimelate decarboxylase [Pseudomonadota bacterium]
MCFNRQNGELYCESVALSSIAQEYGTPTYVYSRATLIEQYNLFNSAFHDHPHLVCYAVKANPNLAILNQFARLGSGFDIVSGGELQRVLAAGGQAGKTVFSGVGKSEDEIRLALNHDILCFNVESSEELLRIDAIAQSMKKQAPISIRVNPDVDAKTHPHISTGLKSNKFGVPWQEALQLYQQASNRPALRTVGIDCHIGSQLTDPLPFAEAASRIMELVDNLGRMGIQLDHIDFGGGVGIRYKEEAPISPTDYVSALMAHLGKYKHQILIEPGRALVGNSGILLTRIEYLKQGEDRRFAII